MKSSDETKQKTERQGICYGNSKVITTYFKIIKAGPVYVLVTHVFTLHLQEITKCK